jgi:acyl-CoA reductase-like NAD-dependent aldehyde dehydrogenase
LCIDAASIKEIELEMCGENPCIVMSEATALDTVAGHIVNGALEYGRKLLGHLPVPY